MNVSKKLMMAASVIAISGSVGVATGSAGAAAEHCDAATYPNKVELDGTSSKVYTGLAENTAVCIKAGTETEILFVDAEGYITNDAILNQRGNARGISYFAYGEENCGASSCPPGGY